MRLERTHNMEVVEYVLNHPTVVGSLTDSESWNHIQDVPSLHFMAVLGDDNELFGLFVLGPHNSITMSVHSAFLPNAYGRSTLQASKLLLDYVFNDIGQEKVITEVPAFNHLARGFAQNSGLKLEGTMTKAYKHKDIIYDLYMYGITKEEYTCLQSPS